MNLTFAVIAVALLVSLSFWTSLYTFRVNNLRNSLNHYVAYGSKNLLLRGSDAGSAYDDGSAAAVLALEEKQVNAGARERDYFNSPALLLPKQVLWLTTCETRGTSLDLSNWMFTAMKVKSMAENDYDGRGGGVEVHVKNVCEGREWKGFMAKLEAVRDLASSLVMNENPNESVYVMFTDSDTVFNPWAVRPREVIDRFHRARNGRSLLVSAEMACWVGHFCGRKEFDRFYPDATSSSCPQFLNSGQYMGDPVSLLNMLNTLLAMKASEVPPDDQLRLIYYFKDRNMTTLDYGSLVFRNLNFGMITPTVKVWWGGYSCGVDKIKQCGQFNPGYKGILDKTTLQIHMQPVPGCPAEERPFSLHSTGPFKSDLAAVVKEMQTILSERSG